MSRQVLDFITRRRSVREFTGDPVPREALEVALRAAMAAPSGNNRRPWQFVVVTERSSITALCHAHPYARFGSQAGAVVIPFGRREETRWFEQDMGAATENLLLAIANLGLGATWCGMGEELQAEVHSLVGLPDDQWAFALIPVGVPREQPSPRTQYEEQRVHWEWYRS